MSDAVKGELRGKCISIKDRIP